MHRGTTATTARLVGLSLALGLAVVATTAGEGSPARISGFEAERSGSGSAPRAAVIGTYGKGASRLDGIKVEPGKELDAPVSPANQAVSSTTKISGAVMAGGVVAFAISPDGERAVYIANQDTLSRFELYSAPVDGSSAPIKISSGLPFGAGDIGVRSFQITPDSAGVVFLADPNLGGGADDIFSAPIDGSVAPVQLNAASAAPVVAFGLTADSASVVFFGNDSAFGGGGIELYGASISVASSARQISDAGSANPQGEVVAAELSPDGTSVVYAADAVSDGVLQWFSVPIGAAGPGSDVQLSSALGSVELAAIRPDSGTVVYTGDDNLVGVLELFSVPIGGGARTRLNPSMAGAGARAIAISSAGDRVAYLADQNTAGVVEVYSARIGVSGSGIRLNPAMSGTKSADTLNLSPDGTMVIYEADQNTPGTFELFGVPIDGSSGAATLHGMTAPDSVGFFDGLGTPVVGRRAVYPVLGATIDLFSVPADGGESFRQLNDPPVAGDTVRNAFLPTSAQRLMAYGVGPTSGTVTKQVSAVSIRRDLLPQQINTTAAAGALGALAFEIASTENHAVYIQDQQTAGKPELFSRALDSDADSVLNAGDNCPFVANPSQGAVVFGQTVLATGSTRFGWNDPAEVRFVRGPLDRLDVMTTDLSGTLFDAKSYSDASVPASRSGFYYLFAPDCPGRSYQTTEGVEPNRDLATLP